MGAGSGARQASVGSTVCRRLTDALRASTSGACQYKYPFFETKKPEPSQDQAQVVTGTTQQHIQLVALCPFQVIAVQQPIRFQMAVTGSIAWRRSDRFNRWVLMPRFCPEMYTVVSSCPR